MRENGQGEEEEVEIGREMQSTIVRRAERKREAKGIDERGERKRNEKTIQRVKERKKTH